MEITSESYDNQYYKWKVSSSTEISFTSSSTSYITFSISNGKLTYSKIEGDSSTSGYLTAVCVITFNCNVI